MENYQLLFPSSSSSSANMLNSSYIDYHRQGQANGFIGLMQSMGVTDSDHATIDGSKRNNMDIIDDEDDDVDDEEEIKPVGKTMMSTKEKKKNKATKEPRYAFETRSQVDILDDGYRWRKYGQKAVKNNKFPRSYYRCTQQGCNVKKQVQRLSRDEGIVVTTYEGMHSHPLDKSTDNFENILTQLQIYSTSNSR